MDEEKKVTKSKKTSTTGTKKTTTAKKKVASSKTTSSAASKNKTSAGVKKTTTKKSSAEGKSTNKVTSTTKKEPVKKSTSVTKAKSTSKNSTSKSSGAVKKTTATKKTTSKPKTSSVSKVKEPEVIHESVKIPEKKIISSVEVSEDVIETQETSKVLESKREVTTDKKASTITGFLIAAIIAVWILILILIGYQIYQKYQEKLYDQGYFYHEKTAIHEITLNNLRTELEKINTDTAFILFNYVGEKDNYNLEKDLDGILNDYHLMDNFYYVNLSKEEAKLNCDATCGVNEELGTNLVSNLPAIVYFKDKKVVDVAQREDKKVLEAADFVKLLDIYEFKK